MQTPSGVLLTRLHPPRLPPGCLPRESLVARLVEGFSTRLVTVLAGAGYGKSTLLAQALARTELPWVFCSCDERMSDRLLVAHLAAGLARHFPGLGAGIDLDADGPEQARALCNEILETVPEDLLLVLDDVHALGAQASEVLAMLVGDLPSVVHIALAGRSPLPFPLGRLRAGRSLGLGARELMLTLEEAGLLLEATGGRLSAERLEEVYRSTEGWVTGLLLAAQVDAVAEPGHPRPAAELFDYLAEEVFLAQAPELQAFLLDTAVLERFTPVLAAAVSGRTDAAELCRELVGRHLFTIRLAGEGGWYRYHHLFQAFLRERLEDVLPERRRELHRLAAAAWVAAGEPLEAVRHQLAAGEPELAAATLEPIAEGLIHTPEAETLAAWLDAFPPELLDGRPGLVLAQASLRFTRGQHEASFVGIERAIDALLGARENERACVAFFRLLLSMIAAGAGPPRRLSAIERFLPRLDPRAPTYAEASVMVAVSYGFGCRLEEAEAALARTMEVARAAGREVLEDYAILVQAFYIDYPGGRMAQAMRGLDRAIARLDRAETKDDMAFGVYARVGRGLVLNDLGRHDEALLELERMREMAERRAMRAPPSRMYAWQRATALAGLGRWEELERELAPPPDAEAAGEVTHYAYRLRAPAALLAAHRGDARAVRELAAASRSAMAAHGLSFEHAWMLCELALAAIRCDLPELGSELAGEARAIAASAGQGWHLARAELLGAVAAGPGAVGDGHLAEALSLTDRHGHQELWTRREREWSGRLLARALEGGLAPAERLAPLLAACGAEVMAECAGHLASAEPRLRALVAEAAGEAAGVDAELLERLLLDRDPEVRDAARRSRARAHARPRPNLQFDSLGGFAVRRGDMAVAPSTFGRQRARALLAALLCAGRLVHREELLEWFWPDLPPARGTRAFHVTLHGLRRALGPELVRPAESNVIVTDGDAYRIVLSEGDSWDAQEFLEAAHAAAQVADPAARLAALQAARLRYTGPLFPEWAYEEWAQARRAQVEHARVSVLELLAEALASAGRLQPAVAAYRDLLALEPEREAWHRSLMRAYALSGEQALALRQFHACRTVLRDEMGVEPSTETRELYQHILTEQPLEPRLGPIPQAPLTERH